jgi:hypothetical protein
MNIWFTLLIPVIILFCFLSFGPGEGQPVFYLLGGSITTFLIIMGVVTKTTHKLSETKKESAKEEWEQDLEQFYLHETNGSSLSKTIDKRVDFLVQKSIEGSQSSIEAIIELILARSKFISPNDEIQKRMLDALQKILYSPHGNRIQRKIIWQLMNRKEYVYPYTYSSTSKVYSDYVNDYVETETAGEGKQTFHDYLIKRPFDFEERVLLEYLASILNIDFEPDPESPNLDNLGFGQFIDGNLNHQKIKIVLHLHDDPGNLSEKISVLPLFFNLHPCYFLFIECQNFHAYNHKPGQCIRNIYLIDIKQLLIGLNIPSKDIQIHFIDIPQSLFMKGEIYPTQKNEIFTLSNDQLNKIRLISSPILEKSEQLPWLQTLIS